MKILVIPDVHLKPYMFRQADEILERGKADQAVCLMDLPDDWGQEYNLELYRETFDEAIAFAVKYPSTLWVYGNHELCYLWDERESGFSTLAAGLVKHKLAELQHALPEENQIRYIQKIDQVVFCHGGIKADFVRQKLPADLYENIDEVIDLLNRMHSTDMWDSTSPIWYRPQYMDDEMYQPGRLLQVVGHTPVEKTYQKDSVISCDVFSLYRDGRPIGSCRFPVIDTGTGKFTEIELLSGKKR